MKKKPSFEREEKKETSKYFQEALSDFTYDAASGRAIRHLTDTGYTASQIKEFLDYPTSLTKIQTSITKYFIEIGTIRSELPVSSKQMQWVTLNTSSEEQLFSFLAERIHQNGEEHSYMSCPFGIMQAEQTTSVLSCLTSREQEYLASITWPPFTVYHRLNRRMLEIGTRLAINSDLFSFYFIKSNEILANTINK